MSPARDPWLHVKLELRSDELCWAVRHNDSPDPNPDGELLDFHWRDYRVRIPSDLQHWLRQTVSALGFEGGPHATGRLTLPVFVDPWSVERSPLEMLRAVEGVLHDVTPLEEQVVVALAPERIAPRRPPFNLPLKVLSIGDRSGDALAQVREAPWYTEDVPEYGMVLDSLHASPRGQAPVADVLVCDRARLDELKTNRARARLIIVIADEQRERWASDVRRYQGAFLGSSAIWAHEGHVFRGELLRHLLEGVIHDYPVHQALKAATRQLPLPVLFDPPLLLSDHVANQNLRLRDAALKMYEQVLDVRDRYDFGSMDPFRRTVDTHLLDDSQLDAIDAVAKIGRDMMSNLDHYVFQWADFTQETAGLAPRAAARRRMAAVNRGRAQATAAIAKALPERLQGRIKLLQDRRVNLILLRRAVDPPQSFCVAKNQCLLQGAPYRLRVNIGRLTEESLIVGESPPVDMLLPAPQRSSGHVLSVAVDGLDFKVQGRRLRRLTLPAIGPSNAVTFDVVAPPRSGKARLRVLVYLERVPAESPEAPVRNHLIQSLLLETRVNEEQTYEQEDVTTARVEFSRTLRFANLDALDRRSLSIAVNLDPNGEHHSLAIKAGDVFGGLELTEAQMTAALKEFRRILLNAAYAEPQSLQGPRFLDGEDAAARRLQFEASIRQLAEHGRQLWLTLFETRLRHNRKLLDLVRVLQAPGDHLIQIVPLHTTLFPWSGVYDAPYPEPGSRLCEGYLRRDAHREFLSSDSCLSTCLFPDRSKAICVYGFWGTRLRIEQLLPGAPRDAVTEVRPVQGRALHVSVGLPTGPALKLPSRLGTELGPARIRQYGEQDNLVDMLFEAPDRAAVLLIVGHSEGGVDAHGRRAVPRITLPGANRWLHPQDISNKLQRLNFRFLADPSPVVVLAACDSAAADLSSFVDFIKAFAGAGAAALVGTEAPVIQQFAAAFSERLALGLFRSESLSAVVRGFRRDLLFENNPLGFVVTSFGDATLALPEVES